MLEIIFKGENTYEAMSGETVVGRCVYEDDGDATVIREIKMFDKVDEDMLDGLLRATLFAGLPKGRYYYEIGKDVWRQNSETLVKLGFSDKRELLDKIFSTCKSCSQKQ